MTMRNVFGAVVVAALAGSAFAQTAVDVELSLAVDVSGSIDTTEFNLQRQGYVNAFNDPVIRSQILSTANGRLGRIAVNLIYWSGNGQQQESVGWTLLDSNAAITNFVTAVNGAARPFSGNTGVSQAMNFAINSVNNNSYNGTRKIIDISSDGDENVNSLAAVHAARNNATGIYINALVIGNESLRLWYQNNVITPTGIPEPAFAVATPTFAAFDTAIRNKLSFEVPAPGAAALLGLGGLVALRRKR